MRKTNQNIFLKDVLFFPVNFIHEHWALIVVYPQEKRMDYLDSLNYHPHDGVYYAIIQYLQKEYEQYYPGESWSDFAWKMHQVAVRKQVNDIDCGVYVCMNVYLLAYQLSLLSITVDFVETEGRLFLSSVTSPHLFGESAASKSKPHQLS